MALAALAGCQTPNVRDIVAERRGADQQEGSQTARYRAGVYKKLARAQLGGGQVADAEKSLAKALQWDPNDPALHLQRSRLHVEKGQLDKAIEDLKTAVRLDPDLADAHYEMGMIQMRLGFRQEALGALNKAIQTDSGRPAYYLGLAACLAACDRKDDSHQVLLDAAQRFDGESEIHETLGESFLMSGQDRRALACFKRSVELADTNLQAKKNLALCYYWVGEYDHAAMELRRLLDHPGTTETSLLRSTLGECLLRQGHYAAALTELERARQLDGRNARVRLLTGHCRLGLRQWAEAARAYHETVRTDPRQPEAHYCQGYAAYRQGRYAEALKHYQEAARLAPGNPLIQVLMGQCYEKLSDGPRARRSFSKALELEGAYDLARRRLARVGDERAELH